MLKLSTRIRYSLRLVVYLCDHAGSDNPVQLKRVSKDQGISMRYLEQLVVPLKSSGIIKSVAGKKGGYYLALPPESLKVAKVVEAAGEEPRLLDCLDPKVKCVYKDVCSSRKMWGLVNARMWDVLNEYTISDLSEKEMYAFREKTFGKNVTRNC
ncbi:MAG: Rrf2 family transcriptional regulator [Deltaproteobacteria bacterium]|nr:Rrf2 family transcriptional regulator [Deltaproteobacteria bacterium]